MSEVLKIFGLLLILASVSSAYGQEFSCDAIEEYLDCTGSKTADIVIVMDTTGSMGGTLDAMRATALDFAAGLATSGINYRLGLTDMRDYELTCDDPPYSYCGGEGDYAYEVYGLAPDDATWVGWLNGLTIGWGADGEESYLAALTHTATDTVWREGAAKKVAILMCDSEPHYDGHCCNAEDETMGSTIAALTSEGVRVYIVHAWGDTGWAGTITSATGGKVYIGSESDIKDILEEITEDLACTVNLESEAECSGDTVKICTQILGKDGIVLPYSAEDTEAKATLCGSEYTLAYDAETESYCAEVPACDVPFDIVVYGRVCDWDNTETITVDECNLPPDCSAAVPSVDIIWPPNHEFVPVDILGVTDPDEDPITINIDEIWQDEPVDTVGDGSFVPDGMVGPAPAQVRAERSGTPEVPGDGRVYHISFTATDEHGATCEGEVTVGVPHDKKDTPVDGGALYDSTAEE